MARSLALSALVSVVCPSTLPAQAAPTPPPEFEEPLLTLEEAVSLAVGNNRAVKISVLETEKSEDQVSIARSRRLPKLQVDVMAGSLLQPFDYTFPAGAFGTYESTGPIPSEEAKVRTPAKFTTFTTGAVDQPLSQLYELNLGVRATELGREIAREGLRAERQKVAASVRSAYFDLVAAQATVDAARDTVKTLREVQRVTADYEVQQVVLRAESLDVGARLQRSQYDLSVAENRLATQRERLNDLLGRELTTSFRVEPMPEQDGSEWSLESARQRAAENRPEVRQAQLRERQADYERRIAKADYIPDVSLSVRYLGFYNFEVLPRNVATAGLFLSWEPFDWGRRRHKVAERARAVEQARHAAQQTQSQVAIEVGISHRKWREAALLVRAARTGYEAAREHLRVSTNRYRHEAAILRDLLQVQAQSTEAQSRYQQALSGYWSAMADLRRAMGEE
jgi:outer membrane protein TolC